MSTIREFDEYVADLRREAVEAADRGDVGAHEAALRELDAVVNRRETRTA